MKRTWLCAWLALGCSSKVLPPKGQVLFYIDTDAPVPSIAASADDPLQASALFDRMRVEILGPTDTTPCARCSNEFAIDRDSFLAKKISIGVELLQSKSGYRARVRLFLRRFVTNGTPPTSTTLDRWVNLPTQVDDTVTEAHVTLSVDDVGQPADASPALDTLPGPPTTSLVGTWAGAKRSACVARPVADRACIPGGAYWSGSEDSNATNGHSSGWHRLVTLSPYWIDAHEVTAQEYSAKQGYVGLWSGSSAGKSEADWCTLGVAKSARDPLAMNCLNWIDASTFCQSRGGRLPTAAQFVYVATNLGTSPYVWGYDVPSCDDSIWGRGGYGALAGFDNHACIARSKALGVMGGPEIFGSGLRDRLTVFGVDVVEVNGNLDEFARDAFTDETAPCFQPPILADPVCTQAGKIIPDKVVVSAGGWQSIPSNLRGDRRRSVSIDTVGTDIGFRCVYPDQ